MHTEEAKKKWCPMTKTIALSGNDVDKRHIDGLARCIASECMMWRWNKPRKAMKWARRNNWVPEKFTGHCGLAP